MISDELREFADAEVLSAIQISDLKHMAKRIDAEMVELPKSADGKIWTGREVCFWTGAGNKEYRNFHDLVLKSNRWYAEDDCGNRYAAESVWYERPDSFERIAYDIETVVPIDDEDDERLRHKLADRIRNLAKKEDRQCQ